MFSERWPRQMSANLSRPVFGDDILLLLVTIILCEAILTNGCALNAHRTAAAWIPLRILPDRIAT